MNGRMVVCAADGTSSVGCRWCRLWSLMGLSLVLLTACGGVRGAPLLRNAPTYERGLQLFPSPRVFDPPGTVFRIDPDGVRRPVADLSGLLSLRPMSEAVPEMTVTGRISAGLLLGWLGVTTLSADLKRLDSITVFVGGAKREQAFEVNLRRVIDSARTIVDWERPGSVYIITETVSADTVRISLSRSLVAMIGDSLHVNSVLTNNVHVEWRPQGVTQLNMRFETPHRVFYKAEQLLRRYGGLEVDSLPAVIRLPVDSGLVWTTERS